MDRGVFIGGGLICASFLLAVLLNEGARERVRTPASTPDPTSTEVDTHCRSGGGAPLVDEQSARETAAEAMRTPAPNC